MKNYYYRFCLILSISILVSCSGNSPKSVAKNFLKSISRHDYEGAKKYCTDESKKLMDMFISLEKLRPDTAKKNLPFTVLDEKIKGDTAFVKYKPDDERTEQTLTLIKVDGTWKVVATKENMNELEGGELLDSGATNTDTSTGDEKIPDDSLSE